MAKKKTFKVLVAYKVWDYYEVKARNEYEAREIAEEIAGGQSLNQMECDHYATEIQ